MNVYDFDGTIYDGDSSVDFCRYCLKNKRIKVSYYFTMLRASFLYMLRFYSKDRFKSEFFSFVRFLDDLEQAVREFWVSHVDNIKAFYHAGRKASDVIISASPEFLLKPLCEEWGVTLIATHVDQRTGALIGANCHGEEKTARFRALFPEALVEQFYSDRLSDAPMAMLAESAFLVKKDRITPWNPLS